MRRIILFPSHPPHSQHRFLKEGIDEAEHAEGEEPEVDEVVGVVTVGDVAWGVGLWGGR